MLMADIVDSMPQNETILKSIGIAYSKINSPLYKKILCSISGGSDSDLILDICKKCDNNNKIQYVWCDTGFEYEATKKHLEYLKNRYDINFKTIKPTKSIPTICREYGQPFLSKMVSEYIHRLQFYNFDFKNDSRKSYKEMVRKYPNCKSSLAWFFNQGSSQAFAIYKNRWLREYLIENPPTFKISNKCCEFTKKQPIRNYIKEESFDLDITGIRKAEGGIRSLAYKSCSFFDEKKWIDVYMPLFWYSDQDKKDYIEKNNIIHSECYSKYGYKRTGCAGCPFNMNYQEDLQILQQYEPKLYKAVNNLFGDSYKYTNDYRDFQAIMNKKYPNNE